MKEILFKAKYINSEDWVEGSLILELDKTTIFESGASFLTPTGIYTGVEVERETICQFIKTNTYHGKTFNLFECDIVRLMLPYSDKIYLAEVYFDEFSCAFRAKIHKENGIFIDNLTVLTIIEVAGNIFDNPELINQ